MPAKPNCQSPISEPNPSGWSLFRQTTRLDSSQSRRITALPNVWVAMTARSVASGKAELPVTASEAALVE